MTEFKANDRTIRETHDKRRTILSISNNACEFHLDVNNNEMIGGDNSLYYTDGYVEIFGNINGFEIKYDVPYIVKRYGFGDSINFEVVIVSSNGTYSGAKTYNLNHIPYERRSDTIDEITSQIKTYSVQQCIDAGFEDNEFDDHITILKSISDLIYDPINAPMDFFM